LERHAVHNEAQRPTVSPDALAALQDYPFPVWDWVDANPPGFEYMTEWDDVLDSIERRLGHGQ